MIMNRYFIPIVLLIFMLTSVALVGCGQPPYFKAPGEPVELVNNDRAVDCTWRQVVAFLEWDTTDKEAYTAEHMCGFFAEKLHNRAEDHGIRTALVAVEFETGEPHALNAFKTIDHGLVYVDCTGEGQFEASAPFDELATAESWDKVAYIVEGERIGLISLGYEEGNFNYEWYERCRARLEDFEKELDSYNKQADNYNREVYGRYSLTPWLEEYRVRLSVEKNRLKTEWERVVSGYNWEESESPVRRVRVYW